MVLIEWAVELKRARCVSADKQLLLGNADDFDSSEELNDLHIYPHPSKYQSQSWDSLFIINA